MIHIFSFLFQRAPEHIWNSICTDAKHDFSRTHLKEGENPQKLSVFVYIYKFVTFHFSYPWTLWHGCLINKQVHNVQGNQENRNCLNKTAQMKQAWTLTTLGRNTKPAYEISSIISHFVVLFVVVNKHILFQQAGSASLWGKGGSFPRLRPSFSFLGLKLRKTVQVHIL